MNVKMLVALSIVAIMSVGGIAIVMLRSEVKQLNSALVEAKAELERVSATAEHNAEIARRTMAARDALEDALEAQSARDAEAAKKWNAMERRLKEAVKNEKYVRDWYSSPVPPNVDGMLRKDGIRPQG